MNTPSFYIRELENGFLVQVGHDISFEKASQFERFYTFPDLKTTFDFISDYWNDDLKHRKEDDEVVIRR